jgi:hypothetical protein
MPKGADTTAHKRAMRKRLIAGVRKAANSGVDENAETLLEGKGLASIINVITGKHGKVRRAVQRLRDAERPAAEDNILRRGYNQGPGLWRLENLVDTKDGKKRKR